MSITVLGGGLLTTVQDRGRSGYQQFGVPVSGVVDPRAMSVANILVGNPEDAAVLECTMMGPMLQFDQDTVFAVTGGDLRPSLDGQPVPGYTAIAAKAGQVLQFFGLKSGCRAYVAFAGGVDVAPVMGSRSTYMKAKIGGLEGRKLEKGDVLPIGTPKTALKDIGGRHIAPEFVKRDVYTLHVILGPQDDMFTEAGIKTFLSETYTVTPEFDRMGCRLDGAVIEHINGGDIISVITSRALALMLCISTLVSMTSCYEDDDPAVDPKPSSITLKCVKPDYLKAGDKVRFEKVSVEFAQDALLTQREALRALKFMLGRT